MELRRNAILAAMAVQLVLLGLVPLSAPLLLDTLRELWLVALLAGLAWQIAAARAFAAHGPGRPGTARPPVGLETTVDGWSARLSGLRRPRFLVLTVVAYALVFLLPSTCLRLVWATLPTGGCGNSYDTPMEVTLGFLVWTVLWLVAWGLVHFVMSPPVQVRLRGRVLEVGRRSFTLDGGHRLRLGPSQEQLEVQTREGSARLNADADRIRWVFEELRAIPPLGTVEDVPELPDPASRDT